MRGYSAIHTGLCYLPFVVGLGIAVGSIGPKLFDKLPAGAVIAAGLIIYAGGLAWCVARQGRCVAHRNSQPRRQPELERVVWTTGRCLDQCDFERLRLIFTVIATVVTRRDRDRP